MITKLLLAAAAGVSPVPPPVEQGTANCERPTYASDTFVCGNGELKAFDEHLRVLLPVRSTAGLEMEPQWDWFRRSRLCAMREDQGDCLRAAYAERIAVLEAARAFDPADASWRAVSCEGKPGDAAEIAPGVHALRYQGRLWLAPAGDERVAWKPFVAWTENRDGPSLDWLAGYRMACTWVSPGS